MYHIDENPTTLHYPDPDYDRPLYEPPDSVKFIILDKLTRLYRSRKAKVVLPEIIRLMQVYYAHKTASMIEQEKTFNPAERFSEYDVVLITYGDLIRKQGEMPLDSMSHIARKYFKGVFNTVHILPFFPYSSDRGFAVINFTQVDRNLGSWDNIIALKSDFRLMFDGVFNHVSSKSPWFREFLNDNPAYRDFFTAFSVKKKMPEEQIKKLLRPRTSSVLTEYKTLKGRKRVWTTFSPDQIDLKFQNPRVLLKMLDILLLYVRKGADMIRLDAVTYLWDELGTSGAHLEQTHLIIQLFRDILDAVAPHVALITETNVPHEDNIKYFGNGSNEAQMVYNFALPPLILHTFQKGSSARLTHWADSIGYVSDTATYFNFLDSHDGIGVMGARGILTEQEIDDMAQAVRRHGGQISYKTDGDGHESIYELNITSYSAINLEDCGEDSDFQIRRYIAARSIPLVLIGVPGIYLHGLLGSPNDIEAMRAGCEKRDINRKNLDKDELIRALDDKRSVAARVVQGVTDMVNIRRMEPAFHPRSRQRVINISDELFCIMRYASENSGILTVTNVTGSPQKFSLDMKSIKLPVKKWREMFSDKIITVKGGVLEYLMEPYDVRWFKTM